MEFADSYGIAMPIAREVDGVINHGATPEGAYRGLAAEKPGHEVHGAGFWASVRFAGGAILVDAPKGESKRCSFGGSLRAPRG